MGFSDLPLKAAAGAGIFGILAAATGIVRGKNRTGMTLSGGILLAETGIMSVYIGKIYREVQGRPDYIVKERKEDEKR